MEFEHLIDKEIDEAKQGEALNIAKNDLIMLKIVFS